MGCLEFEVIPEVSLRNEHVEFALGMPVCQTINALQNAARHIRNIELTYSNKVCYGRFCLFNFSPVFYRSFALF